VVLGVPVRHAHSHSGLINLQDVQATLDLTVAILEKLDHKTLKSLLPK
jgi:putative aminopeptidase FrvX